MEREIGPTRRGRSSTRIRIEVKEGVHLDVIRHRGHIEIARIMQDQKVSELLIEQHLIPDVLVALAEMEET